MPLFALDDDLRFPPVHLAEPDGLLAIGGDLSVNRIILAYKQGIFPWYENEDILWWSPDPRFVLFPDELKVSKSMSQLLKKKRFEFSINRDFSGVINQCKTISRRGQESTWITNEVRTAYTELHRLGLADSAEVWDNGKLVGGLYGVRLGFIFFGESMFSRESNASKYAFIQYVQHLKQQNVQLIDCQVYTAHLESLGARMIPRAQYVKLLSKLV
ncbi:MAG: leucyl/phenylalanyl-tRNA--protein transferase [Bacteroidetes bacterium]|nr:MAG: leucyl/phenylalanyl-tRNA--protein transferase [Bacteroidota bacterium]